MMVTYTDKRTGKSYATFLAEPGYENEALKAIKEQAEHDFQMTLPPEKRNVYEDTDYTCPHCKTKDPLKSSRKEKMVSGSLFFVSTRLIDIYTCSTCSREFTEEELTQQKHNTKNSNAAALLIEKHKSGLISKHQLDEALKRLQ